MDSRPTKQRSKDKKYELMIMGRATASV